MSATDTPASEAGTGPTDTIDALASLLGSAGTEAFDEVPEEDAGESEPNEEGSEEKSDTEAEETPEEPAEEEGEEGADEEEDADQDETPEEQPDPLQALHTVKIGGKEEQVTVAEALKGYQRQSDYSQKTAALADERRSLEGEVAKVREERGQYAAILPALVKQLNAFKVAEPSAELAQSDPQEYVRQKAAYDAHKSYLDAADAETKRVAELNKADQDKRVKEYIAENRKALAEKLPAARDPKTWEPVRKAILSYGKKQGFTDQELASAVDHRVLLMVNKARLYDDLMGKKIVPVKKASAPSLKPGSANGAVGKGKSAKASQRLASTGSQDDAAAALMDFV